jgi:high-affinity iron transporter
MLAALLIVFREVFEAGLIIGIVMAVTRSVAGRGWWIAGGVGGGIAGACIAAAFAGALSSAFHGMGQELFNAGILSIAVVMLTWHNVWMARHGRELADEMRAAGEAVRSGAKSLAALAVVVGVAVLREGVEIVLFLYGVAISGESGLGIFAGGVLGLVLGAGICSLTYVGLISVPGRYLFAVTSVMIAFLAAGMAAQATAFLQQAGLVEALGNVVWNTSWIVSEESWIGRALHTLVGYNDQPTGLQLVAYLGTLAVIFCLMRVFKPAAASRPHGRRGPSTAEQPAE